jgi:hypothetical protein
LDKFVALILWEKLELITRKDGQRERRYEPRHVKEPKSREEMRYIGMEKDRCKIWMALGLENLRECMQTSDWLTERLPHVKTFVLNFYGDGLPLSKLLKFCGV